MSESIINALMHLFAIIESVKVDSEIDSGEIIVKPYLNRNLNPSLTSEYLDLYYDYLDFYKRSYELLPTEREMEIASVNILQVSKICNQLNKELQQHERISAFIQLMELINSDNQVSQKEDEFILLVAMNFNIPQDEVKNIKSFILDPEGKEIEKSKALLIDNRMTEWPEEMAWMMRKKSKKVAGVTEFKHLYVDKLFGNILVLHISSIDSFVFRYQGPLNLYLEGNKIYKNKSYNLNPGAIIKGPNIKPIYEIDISKQFLKVDKNKGIVLSGEDIEFHFKNSSNGIQKFTISEESGQLVGIMGGSGTGKSTLLNLLNGQIDPDEGKVLVNGYNIQSAISHGVVGYVPQDDLLFEELTVYQNLYYNAKISFSDFSEHLLKKTVDKVLNDLDLFEIKDLKVGDPLNKSISGGQRKRLNIALELMREPALLYVDEPTSGLSSMDSEKVMWLLKDLSRKGKLVIVIIHQPSSAIFKLFDKLLLLDKGGYPIYSGNPIDAVVYFKTMSTQVNAAESECPNCGNVIPDQILQIIEAKEIDDQGRATNKRKVSPKKWYQKYKEHIEPNIPKTKYEEILPENNFHIPSRWGQFKIFSERNVLTKLANRQYILINILEGPFLAFILGYFSKYMTDQGYIFADNKNLPVYLFMSIVVALFLGMSVSAEEIFKDRRILARESFLNLSRTSYLNSKISFLFVLSAVQSLLFVLVGNLILEIQGTMIYFWAILFTTSCFANMVGLNISSALNSIITIYILIPFILVPQLLLGGAMIKFDDLHQSLTNKVNVPVVGDLMASRWAYEALAVTQFKENEFERLFFDAEMAVSQTSFYNSFLMPKLESVTSRVEQEVERSGKPENMAYSLALLQTELEKFEAYYEKPPFPFISDMTPENYTVTLGNRLKGYLATRKQEFRADYSNAVQAKDSLYQSLVKEHGREKLIALQEDYKNESLSNLVQNRDEFEKVQEIKGELVQKKDPIYSRPHSNIGRAHLYAPYKVVAGIEIDTFYFNLLVLWSMTAILYFTLVNDSLKKLLNSFNRPAKKEKKPAS